MGKGANMQNNSFRCADYMFFSASSVPPKLDMHSHKYYEILYFNAGDACYMIRDNTYHASPGDMFVTAPGEMHCIAFNSEETYVRHFIQISEDFMERIPFEVRKTVTEYLCAGHGHVAVNLVKKYRLGTYFERINDIVGNKTKQSDFLTRTYIMQLVAVMGGIGEDEFERHSNEKPLIKDIKNYIAQNTDKILVLDDIAAKFYINKFYLCHVFREETGMTIKDYINAQKITRACELIRDGAAAGAAQRGCGFKDYSTFYRTFKKYMGISPTEL